MNLLSLPLIQTIVESGKRVQYKPTVTLTDDLPIAFVVPGDDEEFTDILHTILEITASIVKTTGTVITNDDNGVVVRIKLIRSKDTLSIMSHNADNKILIANVNLWIL